MFTVKIKISEQETTFKFLFREENTVFLKKSAGVSSFNPAYLCVGELNWETNKKEYEKLLIEDPENLLSLLEGYETTSTCAEWNQMSDFVTTYSACDFLHQIGSAGCCEPIGENLLKTGAIGKPAAGAPQDPEPELEASAAWRISSASMAFGLSMLLALLSL